MAHRRALILSTILQAAARQHPSVEIVSRTDGDAPCRTTYAAVERRCRRLARVLGRLGVAPGGHVGVLAWDDVRAFEVFHAVTGIGAVAHPLDPRLPPELLAEALADTGDMVLFADPLLAATVGGIAPGLRHTLRRVVVLCEEARMPVLPLPASVGLHCYEPLLAAEGEDHAWAEFDETCTAVLAETAGRGGRRRAVPLSHRALLLSALIANQPDGLGVRAADRVLMPAAPWGFGAAAGFCVPPMAGAALLLPGAADDGARLHAFAEAERATLGIGAPSAWLGLLRASEIAGAAPAGLRRLVCAGDAVPAPLRQGFERLGVAVEQVWGLAEAGPAWTLAAPAAGTAGLAGPAAERLRLSHGRPSFGLELRLLDGEGQELPGDGMAVGTLWVRGPFLADTAAQAGTPAPDDDGWLDTGDTASLDPQGYLLLRDRADDAIRSGGEWISAALLERVAAAHPDVAEAACIGAPHAKFNERPLLLVVPRDGARLDGEAVRRLCAARLPAWWVPDLVLGVATLPRTAGGRVDKAALRVHHASVYADTSPAR